MDFASLMSSAIKKSKTTAPSNSESSAETLKSSKYLRRADLEAQRAAAYQAEQAAAAAAREEKATAKRKLDEEEAERNFIREEKRLKLAEESRLRREQEELAEEEKRRKRVGLPSLAAKRAAEAEAKAEEDETAIPEEEDLEEEALRAKLRDLGEPAVLFAESHVARLKRWRTLTAPKETLTDGPIPTTLLLVPEAEMAVKDIKPPKAGTAERKFLFRQLASYFTMILSEWQLALARRDKDVIFSKQGKQAEQAMIQSRDNLVPLFRRFEKGDLEDSILEPVIEIVRSAQTRRYVDANDAYLRLSIGKA